MHDTDTNGADLDVITILPPEDDDGDARFAAELGRRARKRQIELGEL